MFKVTAIRKQKGPDKQAKIIIEGQPGLKLAEETIFRFKLVPGQDVSADLIREITAADIRQRCLNAASRYLGNRPHSENEIKNKLRHRGYSIEDIGYTIEYLKGRGLIDDEAFARFWMENRQAFRPRSRRLTALELRQKGIPADIADGVAENLDDAESAYRSALKKARTLAPAGYATFRQRLGAFLQRRGFSYETAEQVVKKLWEEEHTS